MNNAMTPTKPGTQAARNRRTALILGGIALAFFVAMFARMIFLGR